MGPAIVLAGRKASPAFKAYIRRQLTPSLLAARVVWMGSLSTHRSMRVVEVSEGRGCELWYPPAYSADMSPIEVVFSKMKHLLRKSEARNSAAPERSNAAASGEIAASGMTVGIA